MANAMVTRTSAIKMGTLSTWDSIERLSYWLSVIRWLPALAGIFTVIAAVSVTVLSNRLDSLRAERAAKRQLSSIQQEEIASQLKRFAGTLYTIRAYTDDEDAINLLSQIVTTLTKAAWVKMPTNHIMVFSLVVGVSIEIAPSRVMDFERVAS